MTITRAELDALRARLATPTPQYVLRPDGGIEQTVHEHAFKQQLKRLREGEKLLNDAHEKLLTELNDAKNQGQQRANFNRKSHIPVCTIGL